MIARHLHRHATRLNHQADVDRLFLEADLNLSGSLSFEEFHAWGQGGLYLQCVRGIAREFEGYGFTVQVGPLSPVW